MQLRSEHRKQLPLSITAQHEQDMISFAILTLFTIPGLCTQLRLVRSASNIFVAESPPVIEQFSWDAIVDRTGVNPSDYLPTPAAGAPETFACTTVRRKLRN